MRFIDHTGHIFSVKSYNSNPIGYQYEINPYVFWLDNEYTHKLSVNNYYMMCIRMLIPKDCDFIFITVEDSKVYSLFSTKDMHELVNNMSSLNDYITINEKEFKKELDINDLIGVEADNENYIVPFYVLGYSKEEGTIISNLMIHYGKFAPRSASLTTEEIYELTESNVWTPISVGGEFNDENEYLIINGKNMGVSLPKDILGSIYQYSYKSEVPDETLYANKIKEYLMNFMHIKGEIGNFNSVLDSLGWFGYGDKIEIQKLLQTDNQFQEQFFLDDFNIHSDLLHSYKSFRNSTYISLRLWDNKEYENTPPEKQDIRETDYTFWGEGKPDLENLFEKTVIKHYDEGDIDFYRSYYDYAFDELGLKLAMLDYYFKKYFLPIHLHIHSTSIAHRVWQNDIKMISVPNVHITEPNVSVGNSKVKFLETKFYYIYNKEFYVDENFNNLSIYNSNGIPFSYYEKIGKYLDDVVLYINQPCVEIPISIEGNGHFHCHLLLLKNDRLVFESDFNIYQDSSVRYDSFVILPKYINKETNDDREIYWLDSKYTIALLVNDKWHYHKFEIKAPEFQLNFGRLIYKYYNSINDAERVDLTEEDWKHKRPEWGYYYERNKYGEDFDNIPEGDIRYYLEGNTSLHKQLNYINKGDIDFNVFMYVPSLVEVNDINFYNKLNRFVIDVHGNTGQTSTEVPGMSQTGVLTRNKILEEFRRKCDLRNISNNGKIIDTNKLLKNGDLIIPEFYFNDYSRDSEGNLIEDYYQIEEYYVDIYFGFFKKGNSEDTFAFKRIYLVKDGEYAYFDPETYNPRTNTKGYLYDGSDNEHPKNYTRGIKLKLNEWNKIFAGDDGQYEIIQQYYQDEIKELKEKYGENIDVTDYELPFKINPCISQVAKEDIFELRIVWNMKMSCEKSFKSSYNKWGQPIDGYFTEIEYKFSAPNQCGMENCFVMRYLDKGGNPLKCKFKEYLDNIVESDVNFSKIRHEHFDSEYIEEMADRLMEQLLNDSINKAKSTSIIQNNHSFLNRIHIYNLYHLGYTGEIDPITKTDVYNEFNNEETDKYYFNKENPVDSIFDQDISSIVPLKYNKEKYGDYKLNNDEWDEKYESTFKPNLYKLYRLFFDEPYGNQYIKWPTQSSFDYDFYLMHDEKNWYVVFISQMPISLATKSDLEAPKEINYIDIQGHSFLLKHYRSGNNFLINRMYFESSNGKNLFPKDSIIVGTIDNVKFPFIIDQGSKWKIEPFSLGIDKESCISVSNANTCIFSIGNKNQKYVKGYYNVDVRYSVDGNVQHQQKHQARICVVD